MAASNLPHANAKRLSSTVRVAVMIGIILITVWTIQTSLRDFSGDYAYTVSVPRTTATTKQIMSADLWMPVVLEDSAAPSTKAGAGIYPTTAIVTASTTALVFNKTKSRTDHSQSSVPRKVHANHSDDAMTATLSHANANATATANKTLSKSKEQPRPHPHAGARDADGNWGYVADVTRIRRWMLQRYRETEGFNATVLSEAAYEPLPPSSYLPLMVNETEEVCGRKPGKGIEGPHGWDVVIKVVLEGPNPLPLPSNEKRPIGPELSLDQNITNISSTVHYRVPKYRITTPEPNGVSKGKILCGVYTYHKMDYRINGVSETWGWRCDGFLPVSTFTIDDPAMLGYGSVDVPHRGPEMYSNMWHKTRSILAYMYDNYFDDYEYFYLAGDDTHLIVENLRRYLYTVEQTHDVATEPLYMGMSYKPGVLHNGGGAGYVLNRVALKMLVLEAFPQCQANSQTAAEDRMIARCFLLMKIDPLDTVDAQGRQRFLGMHPNFIGKFPGTQGVYMKRVYTNWGRKYGWRIGADLVSESSITFHTFRTHTLMKRHHAIIYNSCPVGTVLHAAVQRGRDARRNSTVAVVARR